MRVRLSHAPPPAAALEAATQVSVPASATTGGAVSDAAASGAAASTAAPSGAFPMEEEADVPDVPMIEDIAIVYGGVAATAVSASKTQQWLIGRPWMEETLSGGIRMLQGEIVVPENAPGA